MERPSFLDIIVIQESFEIFFICCTKEEVEEDEEKYKERVKS